MTKIIFLDHLNTEAVLVMETGSSVKKRVSLCVFLNLRFLSAANPGLRDRVEETSLAGSTIRTRETVKSSVTRVAWGTTTGS